jgi:hypothetical protein
MLVSNNTVSLVNIYFHRHTFSEYKKTRLVCSVDDGPVFARISEEGSSQLLRGGSIPLLLVLQGENE